MNQRRRQCFNRDCSDRSARVGLLLREQPDEDEEEDEDEGNGTGDEGDEEEDDGGYSVQVAACASLVRSAVDGGSSLL